MIRNYRSSLLLVLSIHFHFSVINRENSFLNSLFDAATVAVEFE